MANEEGAKTAILHVDEHSADTRAELLDIDIATIPSPALARLIEEVRSEPRGNAHAYNRTYHRHNR